MCGAPCSIRCTFTRARGMRSTSGCGPFFSVRSTRRSPTGANPTAGSGRCGGSPSTSPLPRSSAGWPASAALGWPQIREDLEQAQRWQDVADEIHADVCEHGVDDRGVFVQHYDSDALDASLLLMPLVRFLPPSDERIRNTVFAIGDELSENGLILRYRTDQTDDGLHGQEGTFFICSFWLVSALCRDRRTGPRDEICASGRSATPARSGCTPRRSTPAPVAISATSLKPSLTWH